MTTNATLCRKGLILGLLIVAAAMAFTACGGSQQDDSALPDAEAIHSEAVSEYERLRVEGLIIDQEIDMAELRVENQTANVAALTDLVARKRAEARQVADDAVTADAQAEPDSTVTELNAEVDELQAALDEATEQLKADEQAVVALEDEAREHARKVEESLREVERTRPVGETEKIDEAEGAVADTSDEDNGDSGDTSGTDGSALSATPGGVIPEVKDDACDPKTSSTTSTTVKKVFDPCNDQVSGGAPSTGLAAAGPGCGVGPSNPPGPSDRPAYAASIAPDRSFQGYVQIEITDCGGGGGPTSLELAALLESLDGVAVTEIDLAGNPGLVARIPAEQVDPVLRRTTEDGAQITAVDSLTTVEQALPALEFLADEPEFALSRLNEFGYQQVESELGQFEAAAKLQMPVDLIAEMGHTEFGDLTIADLQAGPAGAVHAVQQQLMNQLLQDDTPASARARDIASSAQLTGAGIEVPATDGAVSVDQPDTTTTETTIESDVETSEVEDSTSDTTNPDTTTPDTTTPDTTTTTNSTTTTTTDTTTTTTTDTTTTTTTDTTTTTTTDTTTTTTTEPESTTSTSIPNVGAAP